MHPAPMKKIDLLVLARSLGPVTRGLGRLGVLHLAHAEAGGGADVAPVRPEQRETAERVLDRVERLLVALNIDLADEHHAVPHVPLAEAEQILARIEDEHDRLRHRRDAVDGQLDHLRVTVERLRNWEALNAPVAGLSDSSFVHVAIGSIEHKKRADFEAAIEPSVVLLNLGRAAGRDNLMAITSARGRWALESALTDAGYEPMPEELAADQAGPAQVVRAAIIRLHETEQQRSAVAADIDRLAEQNRNLLLALRERFRVEIQLLDAQSYFSATDATCLISGWVPADRVTETQAEVLRLTDGRAVVQITDPDEAKIPEEQIPIQLKNRAWARPFEVLVAGFGLPGYRQIEPTVLVGVSFLLMFGVMFGDVGQGAVLAIGGLLMFLRGRKQAIRNAGLLVCFAGCSATAFGFLYGSDFGIPGTIHKHFEPMDEIPIMLGIGIAIGVCVILLGIVLNIINRLRHRDYFHGIFDRFGVVGMVFYIGGLVAAAEVLMGRQVNLWLLSAMVFLPLGVLLLRSPLYRLIVRRQPPQHDSGGKFAAAIESGAELMETVSGLLANTISFVRVGAFALSHAGLCLVMWELMNMVKDAPGGIIWQGLILLVGNVIVIVLEGLVTTIQIVRLEWYEFFGKFFEPKGTAYAPFAVGAEEVKEPPPQEEVDQNV